MAKLTNMRRDYIVRRVMADVPSVDYQAQMRARAIEISVAAMPPPIRRIWEDPELRGFLHTGVHTHGHFQLVTPGFGSYDSEMSQRIKQDAFLAQMHSAYITQRDERKRLEQSLETSIYACSTENVFRERFPELAHYLPEAAPAPINLPAATALIDRLRTAGLKLDKAA